MNHFILASKSPRRKELMERFQIPFDCVDTNTKEVIDLSLPLPLAIEQVAREKANVVSILYPDEVVISADTIVVLNNVVYGKPVNDEDAKSMLKALSNHTHQVITGVCIKQGDRVMTFHQISLVTFYELSDEEIEEYIETGEPLDKAGAYGIQGSGSFLIEKIEGDFFSIMGLPISLLKRKLHEFEKLN